MIRIALVLGAFVTAVTWYVDAQTPSAPHVILLGTIKVKEGREEEFRQALAALNARTRREDTDIVRFEFYKAAPRRGEPEKPETWIEYEEWGNAESAATHQRWAGPILQSTWRELTDSYSFVRLSPIDLR